MLHLFFPDNLCKTVCGDNPGVKCKGDLTKEDDIKCFCEPDTKIFVEEGKLCKGN